MAQINFNNLNKSPYARSKQKAQDTALHKMYLLSEPAFKHVKDEIDNQKYLNDLDKELKKVLYNKHLPKYKKWLRYKHLLDQFTNFKRFIHESKVHKDVENLRKFQEMLDKRVEGIIQSQSDKKQLNSTALTLDDFDESSILENESIIPQEGEQYFENVPENEMFNVSPVEDEDSFESAQTNDNINETIELSGSDTSQIIGTDDSGETIAYQPVKFNINSREERDQKLIDDNLISNKTIHERLNTLPNDIERRLAFPKTFINTRFFYSDSMGADKSYHVGSENINPLDVKILKDNQIKWKSRKEGWVTLDYVMTEDFMKIRNMLIEMHRDVNNEIELFNQTHKANPIEVKMYSYKPYGEDLQLFEYKNNIYQIPNVILDEFIDLVKSGKYSPDDLRMKASRLIKQNKQLQNRSNITFDPLNRTSLALPSSSEKLAARNTSIISTPATKRRRVNESSPILNSTKIPRSNKTLLQKTLKHNFAVVKNPFDQQGKGLKRKWQRI